MKKVWVFLGACLALLAISADCCKRTPKEVKKEDCISFDYNQAEVKEVNGRWKIVVGNMWLLDFGTIESEARMALDIIKHYRMNQQCFVGRPDASMEYYLVNGQAPDGPFPGEDCIAFNPENIEVKKFGDRWKIVEGTHWILDFEDKEDEARQAYNIIKKYGFTYICFVGRPDASMMYFRVGEASPTLAEDCIGFDYNQAEVRNVDGRWKIVVGNMLLLDFGSNENEARQALNLIKHYRMDQQCFVGRPDPSMEYYLVNGQAPNGPFSGEDCIAINPDNIEVKKLGDRWKIVEGNHLILDFEDKEDEARQAYRIIKKYGFTYICFVGRPDPSMMYFRK